MISYRGDEFFGYSRAKPAARYPSYTEAEIVIGLWEGFGGYLDEFLLT